MHDKYRGGCLIESKLGHLPLLHALAVFLVPRSGLRSKSAWPSALILMLMGMCPSLRCVHYQWLRECLLFLERERQWMGWSSTSRSPPALWASPFTRLLLFPSYHFHVHIKQLMGLKWNCGVRTIHSKYLFSKTICWAPGQTAGLVSASDFLESAASGFAALLPRFLVKQLMSSKKLWLHRYKGMADLPKYFQVLCLWMRHERARRVIIPSHTGVWRYRYRCFRVEGVRWKEREEQLVFFKNLFF